MKQLVILAGGKGTRLKERLGALPKPLIDVCGTPLLERQILLAKRYGFSDIIILVNHLADSIVDFCKSKNNWDLNITCIDDGEPRGTAGAVLQIFDQLEDEFLLMYGDTMLEVDIDRFYEHHAFDNKTAATLFLHPNDHPYDSDLVEMDSKGNIMGFFPYPHDPSRYFPNLVNAALYWIRKYSLAPFRDLTGNPLDFGKNLFPMMLAHGLKLRGYNSPEYIKDCGTPKRIDKVCADFLSGKIARAALSHPQMAVFVDRDGTINREVDHLSSPDQLELLPGVEESIQRLNASEYRVCVATNQPVVARGECSFETLSQIHNKLETLLGRQGAFFDRIYYCPHHPDAGFAGEIPELKIKCDCRKPEIGLIKAAISELNICLEKSWFIGDTTTDMATAQRAGIKSILVETGYAGLDHKHWTAPDFIVPNLYTAVEFILDIYPRIRAQLSPLIEPIEAGNVLFIGGQSRSGKSSVASTIRGLLREKGLTAHIISTDRWLLSEKNRGVGVLNRHAVEALTQFLTHIVTPETRLDIISLPMYLKAGREHIPSAEAIAITPRDVFIVEGVVALHFAELFKATFRFFVDVEESLRKSRISREYTNRGYSFAEIDSLYSSRFQEEFPWVNSTAKSATRISIPTGTNNQ